MKQFHVFTVPAKACKQNLASLQKTYQLSSLKECVPGMLLYSVWTLKNHFGILIFLLNLIGQISNQ